MSYEQNTLEAAVGTSYVVADQGPVKGLTNKLASVQVGTPEAYYLLATYCFDLSRKLEYLAKVARPFADFVPPELADEIVADNKAINAEDLTWEQRAKVAEEAMIRLHREVLAMSDRPLTPSAQHVGR